MANPKIQVDIAGDATKLKRAAKDADEALDRVDKSASKLGSTAGGVAKDHLGVLGEAAEGLGLDLDKMDTGALAAGAGLVALGGFALQGVAKFTDLADSVRKVADASGMAFEDASKLVAVSDDLGISSERVAVSMGRLAKNIDAGAMEKYGIEVVRAKDGTVDMTGTLGAVADAMNNTADPTRRAAIGNDLFGRSWVDLQPILQRGSKGLAEAYAEVSNGQIVTEENADAAREWSMALDDAEDAVMELQMAMGKEMLPKLVMLANDFSTVTQAVNRFSGDVGGLSRVIDTLNPISALYSARLLKNADDADTAAFASDGLAKSVAVAGVAAAEAGQQAVELAQAEQNAAQATKIYAERQKDAAEAAKEAAAAVDRQKAAVDRLNGAVLTVVGTQLAYDAAVAQTNESTDSLTQRHAELTDAVATYGEGSVEAWEATKNYENGLREAKSAADSQAQATANLAEQTALAAGASFSAEQKNLVYRDSLVKLRDGMTDPNLVAGMNQLIGLVDSTAASASNAQSNLNAAAAAASRLAAAAANAISITSSGQITTSADAAERALQRRAGGGPVNAGQPYLVGERGPEIVVPGASGAVVDNGRLNGAGGGGPIVVQLMLDGRVTAETIVPHNQTIDRSHR